MREWEEALVAYHRRFKSGMPVPGTWWRAGRYMFALMLPVERKNTWQLAEAVGDETPYNFQQFLKASVWDDQAVCDEVARYVYEHLGEPDGVLALDETGFIKKGRHSAGVARQYVGCTGQVENAQVGVFAAYVGARGAALVDRELYLPKEWTDDRERCRKAHVPDERTFATKIELARRLVARALHLGAPVGWVVADSVYGADSRFRGWLEGQGLRYVLGVTAQYLVWNGREHQPAGEMACALPASAWKRHSAGAGVQGPRWFEWALRRVQTGHDASWGRWVLFRRDAGGDVCAYLVAAPAGTPLSQMVRAAGARWAIETCFEQAKQEVGLGDYEVRSWHGWYRHITLALAALAFLVVMRHEARTPEPDKKGAVEARERDRPMAAFKRNRGLSA